MKVVFTGHAFAVSEGECNVWVSYDPIVPNVNDDQALRIERIDAKSAIEILSKTGAKSDYSSEGLGDRGEALILETLGDYAPGPTYDRHVIAPGDFLLQIRDGEEEGKAICEFMFIAETVDE